jgi:hypothetical protein
VIRIPAFEGAEFDENQRLHSFLVFEGASHLRTAKSPDFAPKSGDFGLRNKLNMVRRTRGESLHFIYNTSGFLSLDGCGFLSPIRTSKTTAIVDGRLNVCGEGELTYVEENP